MSEVSAQSPDLDEQIQQLRESNRNLRYFAHYASHDLQEPLRALRGYSKELRRVLGPALDPTAEDYLEKICSASQHMSRLVRDLLDYARLGDGTWRMQPVNGADLFLDARSQLSAEIREAQAMLQRYDLCWVYGDPTALRLLFKALLSNALKFRRGSHPRIEVGSLGPSGPDERVRFWFRDDGVGIPLGSLEEVFQPFRRLHTMEEYSGSGLGLAMAARIVERHRGRIWIEPNPIFGVTVWVELPGNRGDR